MEKKYSCKCIEQKIAETFQYGHQIWLHRVNETKRTFHTAETETKEKGMRCKPRFMCNAKTNNIGISFTKHREPWVKNALTHKNRLGLSRGTKKKLSDPTNKKKRQIHIFSREVSFRYDNIVGGVGAFVDSLLMLLCSKECVCMHRNRVELDAANNLQLYSSVLLIHLTFLPCDLESQCIHRM